MTDETKDGPFEKWEERRRRQEDLNTELTQLQITSYAQDTAWRQHAWSTEIAVVNRRMAVVSAAALHQGSGLDTGQVLATAQVFLDWINQEES